MSQEIENTAVISSGNSHNQEAKVSFRGGKWDKEEHHKFIEGLFIYGNQWKKMQKYIKTRSSIQVRSHSQKFIVKIKSDKYIKTVLLRINTAPNIPISVIILVK